MSTRQLVSPVSRLLQVFNMLFEERTTVNESQVQLPAQDVFAWGVCVGNGGEELAWLATDRSFAVMVAAALTMIPPDAAREAIEANTFSENMADNLREVFDVCATVFHNYDGKTIRFREMALGTPASRAYELRHAMNPAFVLDVDLAKYGRGRLALLV